MAKRGSLVIFLPTMASGGAERLHLNLAPAFMAAGYDVTFLLQRLEGSLAGELPPGLRVVSLNSRRTLTCIWPLMRFLRRERPALLVANLGFNNLVSIWARILTRVPTRIIASQHSALTAQTATYRDLQSRILPFLYRAFLKQADGIVAVSQGVADDLAVAADVPPSRVTVIYNPVILPNFDALMNEPVRHPWLAGNGPPVIIGVGRLTPQKDFSTLLSSFALVAKNRDARLILLGEGPQLAMLTELAGKLGVRDKVDFPGFRNNPLPYMRMASVLAMSSRYEGFGNVLVEALACGTPVVSTDCPYGPSEILGDGAYGRLVPVGDAPAMAQAIIETLDHPPAEEILQAHGRAFTVQRAAGLYVRLFEAISR